MNLSVKNAPDSAFCVRGRLQVAEVAVDPDGVLELAHATGLSAYDASYLWLARKLGAELVTMDRQLAAAASKMPGGLGGIA